MNTMKKKICMFASAVLLSLSSCNSDEKTFDNYESGTKIDFSTGNNVSDFIKVSFSVSTESDKNDLIDKINYSFNIKGYSALSYYISAVSAVVSYQFLGDSAEYEGNSFTITLNPGSNGNCSTKNYHSCSYRNVKDITYNLSAIGFAIKK